MRTTGREMRPVQAGAYRPRKARHTPASRELVKKVPLFLAPFIRQAADTPPGRLFAAVKKADVRVDCSTRTSAFRFMRCSHPGFVESGGSRGFVQKNAVAKRLTASMTIERGCEKIVHPS